MASGEKLGGRTCAEVSDAKLPSRNRPVNEKYMVKKEKKAKMSFYERKIIFKPSLISKKQGWASKFV